MLEGHRDATAPPRDQVCKAVRIAITTLAIGPGTIVKGREVYRDTLGTVQLPGLLATKERPSQRQRASYPATRTRVFLRSEIETNTSTSPRQFDVCGAATD